MGKPKIVQISSEEYLKGRWDLFKIELIEDLINPLSMLFKDFGFDEEVILSLDTDYSSLKGFYPFYSKNVKAYIYVEGDFLNLIFDTSLPKDEIIAIMEKHFQFPK